MPAAQCASLRAAMLHAACRVDGGELAVECVDVSGWHLLDRADGSQRAHRCAEEDDAGEEEEGLLFGGGWHAVRLLRLRTAIRIELLRAVRKSRCRGLRLTGHEGYRDVANHLQTV